MPATSLSLVETVAGVRQESRRMKRLLEEARLENAALKSQLKSQLELPDIDLDWLRRKILFRCHPDQGGDTVVMQQTIALFDFLVAQ
jgi:hypothetical protein